MTYSTQRTGSLEQARVSYEVTRQVISDAICNREPCSLVRIGDGESVILDWPNTAETPELKAHLKMWLGTDQVDNKTLAWLKKRLVKACRNALILGVPTRRQVGLHARYRSSYDCLEALFTRSAIKGDRICDAAVHRLLQLSGDLAAMLHKAEFLGLITSHNVAADVQRYLEPRLLCFYRIPTENSDPEKNAKQDFQWLPNGYREIRRALHVPHRGSTFLVGGGLMGKLICDDIRRKGGIAIDIGSIFDGWARKATRAYFNKYPSNMYTLDFCSSQASSDNATRMRFLVDNLNAFEGFPDSLKITEKDRAV